MIFNLLDADRFAAWIVVKVDSGSTVTATLGSCVLTGTASNGQVMFRVPRVGNWAIKGTLGGNSASATISITASGQSKSVALTYNKIPALTYTGQYKIVDDSGTEITSTTSNNWNIRLLTSGTLTFTDLRGTTSIDVFLVGGGGGGAGIGAYPYSNQGSWSGYYFYGNGGGGAGHTKTVKSIAADINTAYAVTIGSGGAAGAAGKNGSDGGASSIAIGTTTYSAAGGKAADGRDGGNGGSGGGAGALSSQTESPYCGGAGGTDGGDGVTPTVPTYCQGSSIGSGGTGQGTTTRAFGDINGVLYATGGGGAGGFHTSSGVHGTTGAGGGNNPNTGDGGIGGGNNATYAGYQAPTAGGSGVIIIRNHRTA